MRLIKENYKDNKIFYIILFLIIISGLFLRFNDYAKEGFWNDDYTTIPTGVAFFFPHSEYPGLLGQGEPALGNWFIGKSCIFSGEDFSSVTKLQKNFFVGRDDLLGKQMIKAIPYCHFPMYFFGTIFFLAIILLSLFLIGLRASLFVAAYFAYSPFLLIYSRWLHVDIIMYSFVALGLIFLWLAYNTKKNKKSEYIYFALTAIFFSFAFSTKLPAALFFIFGFFIIFQKYWIETKTLIAKFLNKIDLKLLRFNSSISFIESIGPLIKNSIIYFISFFIALLPGFEYNFSNIFEVINQYRRTNAQFGAFGFNMGIIEGLTKLIYKINIFDTILLVLGLIVFIKLLLKKNKKKYEIYILSLTGLLIICAPFISAFSLLRVLFIFMIGFFLLTGLVFSEKSYLIKNFRLKNSIVIIFILIYIIFQFGLSFNTTPYFFTKNHLACSLNDNIGCHPDLAFRVFSLKIMADYLILNLDENETYFTENPALYYYIRQGQSYEHYGFRQAYREKLQRNPTIMEYIKNFKPLGGKNIRYVLLYSGESDEKDFNDFKKKYKPNEILKFKNIEVIWVYDINNLKLN